MDTIEEKKKKRLLLLKDLYDKSDGNSQTELEQKSLDNYDEGIMSYLVGEELAHKKAMPYKGAPPAYSITHKGIKEIEQAHNNPTQPSTYFPHLTSMCIHIQQMK